MQGTLKKSNILGVTLWYHRDRFCCLENQVPTNCYDSQLKSSVRKPSIKEEQFVQVTSIAQAKGNPQPEATDELERETKSEYPMQLLGESEGISFQKDKDFQELNIEPQISEIHTQPQPVMYDTTSFLGRSFLDCVK